MEHTQLIPGVVKRSRPLAAILRQARRRENAAAAMARWVVWYRFGGGRAIRASVVGCPHEAQAECNALNAMAATRSWITRTEP